MPVISCPFRKGLSGNPGGRAKGLAAYVRDNTLEGEDLVVFYLAIFTGERIDGKKPGLKHRMEAGTWLSGRGFSKVVQQSYIKVGHHKPVHRISTYSDEQLQALLDALENWALHWRSTTSSGSWMLRRGERSRNYAYA